MKMIPRSPFVRTVVIPLTLAAFLSGCHKWTPVEMMPSEVVAGELDRARVVQADGHTVELERMAIVGDSLLGYTPETTTKSAQRVAISLDDISRMETQNTNTTANAVIFAGVFAVVLVGLGVLFKSALSSAWDP